MKKLDASTKFAHLGKPGTTFTKGFQRRLDKVLNHVELKDKVILDQGCGEGVWLERFSEFTGWKNIYGFDIDRESIENLKKSNKTGLKINNLKVCSAENLDFPDNFFDVVFSNEVLEHVEDDKKSIAEVLRVLKPGGKFVVFTPNRGWPFETHGMFFRGKYYWGNIPFLPWMPRFVRNKFSPHVRNYGHWEVKRLFKKNNLNLQSVESNVSREGERTDSGISKDFRLQIVTHSHVFPAFDKLVNKLGTLGKVIQKTFHLMEKTPLHFFGISHFIVVEKVEND